MKVKNNLFKIVALALAVMLVISNFSIVLGTTITNKIGLTSIIKCNLIIAPLVLVIMLVLFLSTSHEYVWQRALPVLGNGFNQTFIRGLSNIYAFGGISILYLISPLLYKQSDLKKVGFFSIAVSSVYLILAIASLLFMFPFITNTQTLLSIYIATREMNYGEFIQRTDAIFILIWILAIFSYLSIVIGFILTFIKEIIPIKFSKSMIYSTSSLIFSFSLLPENFAQIIFTEDTIYKYVLISLSLIISPIILILGVLKKRKNNKYIDAMAQLSEKG